MKVSEHATLLKTNPRYAELCESIHQKWLAVNREMEILAEEFPVEDGYYCIWGDDHVCPTHNLKEY